MIFDFTDVERLCNKPVTVIIPGVDGPYSVDCWASKISEDKDHHIQIEFVPYKEYPEI